MKVHSEAFWKETQRPNTRLEKVRNISSTAIVIGIGATSGGGKTRIAEELEKTLNNAKTVHFDEFDDTTERPADMRSWLQSGADYNEFKTPGLTKRLLELKRSDSHEFIADQDRFIVFDAPLGRAHRETGQLIDLMVFLDTPLDVAMARRLVRDGFQDNPESALKGYLEWSRDLFLEHIHQLSTTSDLILDGTLQPSVLVDHIVDELKKRHSECSSSAQAISRSKSPTKSVFNCAMTTAEIKADYDATK